MRADALLGRILEYGADESGINDRFAGDAALYKTCFDEFIAEVNFDALKDAMAAEDYQRAFAAAHALKGIAGNLGVTAFYDAIHTLVESLRIGNYENVAAEYAEVVCQRERLLALAAGEDFTNTPEKSNGNAPLLTETVPGKTKKKPDKPLIAVCMLLLAAVAFVGFLFSRIIDSYQENTARESANHLIELNHQVKLYIEGKMAADWRTAYSLADTVADGDFIADDEAVISLLRRKKEIWDVTDIRIYTDNGYNISAEGTVDFNTFASDVIANIRTKGRYSAISESNIIYVVPVDTPILYNGSRIVAVSVAQSMESFLDDMGFASFDGTAAMYLTKDDGVVISKLTDDSRDTVYNISVVINGREVRALTGGTGNDPLTGEEAAAYSLTDADSSFYLVSTPIATRLVPLRLFYAVPTGMVNETVSNFSSQLIMASMVLIALFAVIAVVVFLTIYQARKKQFNEQLVSRDYMFDQLIRNTNMAFGLFRVNEPSPAYLSANAQELVGDAYWTLGKDASGYFWKNCDGQDSSIIRSLNEIMQGWDGKEEFRSGYVYNDTVVPPKYFEIRLYPTGHEGKDFVGMAMDVTEARNREEETSGALALAKRANAAKSAFLSNMSHDIRTPMNAIVNMAEFAKESIGNPKAQAEYLDTIIESSHHLLTLINDILDMSRIDSGNVTIVSEPFNLRNAMTTQTDIIRILCEAKHQTFLAELGGIHTQLVLGDELKFSQIIANILSNAMKFTPQNGAIRITATELPAASEDMTVVRISVEDTGCGISADYLPHVFDVFSRADRDRISRVEGSGLGLSICKSYVDAMGGTIFCESEEGEGSTFVVELCFAKLHAAVKDGNPESIPGDMPFFGMHCLVAEDIETNRTIAKLMLSRLGFAVDIAENGQKAVSMFQQSRPGQYDVIYMDIRMPVMDGYEATEKIRESAHPQACVIPIVSMTANAFTEDAEKARAAGMDGHIKKPIESVALVQATREAIRKRKEIKR